MSLAAASCHRSNGSPSESTVLPDAGPAVLAVVNGTPITETDFQLRTKGENHKPDPRPDYRKSVVDNLILEQLQAARAVELGLEKDPGYQAALRPILDQLAAAKRKVLSDAFVRNEITAKAEISDEEASRYFEANKQHMQTETRVMQILERGEAAIQKVKAELDQGVPFAKVASEKFPPPTDASHPWDLGYLKWDQLPEAWQGVLDGMKNGDTSGILKGPRNRFWIIQLVDKREQPSVTFESIKSAIKDRLKRTRLDELQDKVDAELKAHAHIEYSSGLQ